MIAVKYSLFAIIATMVNLASQYITLLAYSGSASLYIAMLAGTVAGLVTKYILDKKYIFFYISQDRVDDAKKFTCYTLMGLFTTTIFWATEIAFDTIFAGDYAKYLGAVIGLAAGYSTKYFLDKQYVFRVHAL